VVVLAYRFGRLGGFSLHKRPDLFILVLAIFCDRSPSSGSDFLLEVVFSHLENIVDLY